MIWVLFLVLYILIGIPIVGYALIMGTKNSYDFQPPLDAGDVGGIIVLSIGGSLFWPLILTCIALTYVFRALIPTFEKIVAKIRENRP